MTEEQQQKFESAGTLLEKVRVMLEDIGIPEVVYNEVSEDICAVDGIALVQCFYGTDLARIRATVQALEFNLRMTRRPSTWVFVECQKSRSDCAFGWLKNYGVKHVFVKCYNDSEGIMLKSALWNIGVNSCSEDNLCFVDSDVVMCQSNWIELAKNQFDSGMDVLSLSSHQYYQSDESCKISESIGHKYCNAGKVNESHCGFTIGIKRDAWETIGGFDPTVILDDLHLWRKIVGDAVFSPFREWVEPFLLSDRHKMGHNLNLGWIDNIACHIWHGDNKGKYHELTSLLKNCGIKRQSDIIDYDWRKPDHLPKWVNSRLCNVIRKTILAYYSYVQDTELGFDSKVKFDIMAEYRSGMSKAMGSPDEKHPLFVCSTVKDRFGLKIEDFTKFRDTVENKFLAYAANPVVLFFTDCSKYDFKGYDLNVVPLKNYDPNDEFSQCMRTDLKYPKNVVVYYVPFGLTDFNSNIWVPDQTTRFADGTVLARIGTDG